MCSTVVFILHFVQMPEIFSGFNVGLTFRFDKIGRMVNSLGSVIHSHPNPKTSMMQGSTYLRENNYISIYSKILRDAFHHHYDKGVECE